MRKEMRKDTTAEMIESNATPAKSGTTKKGTVTLTEENGTATKRIHELSASSACPGKNASTKTARHEKAAAMIISFVLVNRATAKRDSP
jgi:hypothetical protein